MKKKLFTLFLLAISLSVHAQHFIKDTAFRQKVEAAWKQKMDLIGWKYWEDKGIINDHEHTCFRYSKD